MRGERAAVGGANGVWVGKDERGGWGVGVRRAREARTRAAAAAASAAGVGGGWAAGRALFAARSPPRALPPAARQSARPHAAGGVAWARRLAACAWAWSRAAFAEYIFGGGSCKA